MDNRIDTWRFGKDDADALIVEQLIEQCADGVLAYCDARRSEKSPREVVRAAIESAYALGFARGRKEAAFPDPPKEPETRKTIQHIVRNYFESRGLGEGNADRLSEEIKESLAKLPSNGGDCTTATCSYVRQVADLQAQIETLRAYAEHKGECEINLPTRVAVSMANLSKLKCTCGLDALPSSPKEP